MPDYRNNVEIAKTADAPPTYRNNYSQSNYIEAPNDGGKAYGSQARLTLWREWRSIIYRHRWLILSIVVVAISFAAIQACRVKPVYQATTTIDISPETSSLSKSGGVLVFGPGDNTKAEAVIIKSLPVLKKTILSLNLDKNPSFLDVDAKRPNPESLPSGSQQANAKNAKSFDDPADVLTTTRAERVRLAPYVQALLDNLKVEGVRETRLIRVSFTHTNPEIAAAVANGVANSFISHNFQLKTERFTNTSKWLEESTQKLKEQVEDSERKLANYSRQHNIFSLEGRENLTADKMVRLHDQAMRAETARLLKQTLFEEVKNGRGAQLPESFADPKTAELRKTFNELGVTAAQLSVKFGPKHPKLVEIRQQMATLQEQIKDNQSMLEERLKADYGRAVGEEKSLKAALMISKGEAVRQNQAAIQYSILQQDLATAKSLYTDFLNKTSQANIQRAEQFNNVRLIEGAEPPESPIGPNRYLPIVFSLILSLTLGIGLAYLMENLNTTLRTAEEVSRVTQLPMLAVIPTLKAPIPEAMLNRLPPGMTFWRKWSQGLRAAGPIQILDSSEQPDDDSGAPVVDGSERMVWAASEAYRMLRTSILLSTAEHPPKTVLVTSGQPGDGKTATVFNIAYALAQLNAEVVIVDCDMRKPNSRKLRQLANGEGLSTLLTAGGDLNEFIKTTSVPHLSVLPCGAAPPNPSELISSDKMKELLRSLAARFDYVIIDSPPLATFTDPMILSTLVDGVILVVKSGRSKSELVRRVCQELSNVGAKVLGVTLNSFNMRREGYGYYQYYRYYSDYKNSDSTGQNSRNFPGE